MLKEKHYYLNYPLDYNKINNLLLSHNKKKVNFFIDFNSICKGFYKTETVLYEIGEYSNHGKISGKLIIEFRNWINNIWKLYKEFDPFFIIFYDDGKCLQNKEISPSYKNKRTIYNLQLDNDEKLTHLFRKIRKWYYCKIKEQFEKPDLSYVLYSMDYETDLVPYYCLKYGIFDSNEMDVMNIILSLDKDLLQTTAFPSTIQAITCFKLNKNKDRYCINFQLYDNNNAIQYIYSNFKPGLLTARHIPLILSLCGDKSDDIAGITGIGVAKAIKLIEKNSIPYSINEIKLKINQMPLIIQNNINKIIKNYKLISFEEQIKRLPQNFLNV